MAQLVAASLRKGEDAGAAGAGHRDKNLDIQQERAVLLGAMACPRTPWTPSPPVLCAMTPAGVEHRCASA